MNIKFLTFALACGLAAAQPPPPPPHEHPNCTVGTDAPACTLPDGTAGMFLCHPHPFHEHGHHHDEDDHGGILGAFRHVVGHMTGGHHHHPSGHKHEGHGHHGHHHGHHGGSHKGPHRQLRSGSSSSSSSSSSRSSSFHHGPHGGMGHGHGPHGMERQGPPGMGPHGPHGKGPCGHGPPGKLLSDSHCVPVDGPPMDHPFHPPHHGHHDHPPHDPPTCGCCGDVCPAQLDCGCTCDLTDWDGNVLEKGAGVWVTVTLKDKSTLKKCVHAGAYADANRVQCVTDCTADDLVEEAKAMELMEENFGEEEDLEEKESRD